MKGFITRTVATACLACGLGASTGCWGCRDLVDPCYPSRYNFAARQEVCAAIAPQVQNGHVLDQTIWNYHFEVGKAVLTPGGMDHLNYLIRRRPCPDPVIFLATAQDIGYDAAAPDKFVEARADLNKRRQKAITDYVGAQTSNRLVVQVEDDHNPAETYMNGMNMHQSTNKWTPSFQGTVGTGGSSGGSSSQSSGSSQPPGGGSSR